MIHEDTSDAPDGQYGQALTDDEFRYMLRYGDPVSGYDQQLTPREYDWLTERRDITSIEVLASMTTDDSIRYGVLLQAEYKSAVKETEDPEHTDPFGALYMVGEVPHDDIGAHPTLRDKLYAKAVDAGEQDLNHAGAVGGAGIGAVTGIITTQHPEGGMVGMGLGLIVGAEIENSISNTAEERWQQLESRYLEPDDT